MLLRNATLAGTDTDGPHGLIERGAVAIEGDRIIWGGSRGSASGPTRPP